MLTKLLSLPDASTYKAIHPSWVIDEVAATRLMAPKRAGILGLAFLNTKDVRGR